MECGLREPEAGAGVAATVKYAAIVKFSADSVVTAPPARPAHREYLTQLRDSGKLVLSGPFIDGGALIVYEAEKPEDVEPLITADPFARAGVFASWEVHPWNILFINRDLLPE
jgi:uncharacterized protein